MEREEMQRGLKPRHVEMIALGGTIGVGLFMGSANTIMMPVRPYYCAMH